MDEIQFLVIWTRVMRQSGVVGVATIAFASVLVACGSSKSSDDDDDDDIVVIDAGSTPDVAVGTPDAPVGTPDAPVGTPDAPVDPPDASAPDAGPPDATPIDAGTDCTPFATGACLPGSWCKPTAFTGIWEGMCVPFGSTPARGSCTVDGDCGAGLVCGIPDPLHGGASCQPVCDPSAIGGEPGFCAGVDDSCAAITGEDYGMCVTDCTPFASPDGCGAGQFCFPGTDAGGGVWDGVCVTPGATAVEDVCLAPGECVADSMCAGKPFPAGESDGFHCWSLCDPGVGCGGSDACVLLGDGMGGTLDYGVCIPTCTPFETGTAAGCAVGEWCMPDLFDATLGFCAPDGTTADGDACTMISECVAGDWCLADECREICEDGAGSPPGSCAAGSDVCIPLSSGGTPLPVGACYEGCSFPGTCTDVGETCMMAELFALPDDFCLGGITTLAAGADCVAAGMADGDLCGANSACLDDDGGGPGTSVTCYDICRDAVGGGFGASPHPDCRIASETCTDTGGVEIGICLP